MGILTSIRRFCIDYALIHNLSKQFMFTFNYAGYTLLPQQAGCSICQPSGWRAEQTSRWQIEPGSQAELWLQFCSLTTAQGSINVNSNLNFHVWELSYFSPLISTSHFFIILTMLYVGFKRLIQASLSKEQRKLECLILTSPPEMQISGLDHKAFGPWSSNEGYSNVLNIFRSGLPASYTQPTTI